MAAISAFHHVEHCWPDVIDVEVSPRGGFAKLLSLPEIREVAWPQDRFVEYEKRDEAWAIPLGFASESMRQIQIGDVVPVWFVNRRFSFDAVVDDVRVSGGCGEMLVYRVDLIGVHYVR